MRKHRQGLTAVALVMTVGSAFMVMSASAGDGVDLSLRHASRSSFMARTHYAAYGALQSGLDRLNAAPNYACDNINNKAPVDNDDDLVAGMSISNNGTGATPAVAFDGSNVPPGMAYIKVEADFRDYPGKFTATYHSRLFIGSIKPDAMILMADDIKLTNTTLGAKGQLTASNGTVYNLTNSKSARIITNGISPNSIIIEGENSRVNASVRWGPLADPTTVLNVVAPAVLNSTAGFTRQPLTFPARIARFRPYTNPRTATDNLAVDNQLLSGGGSLPPGEYANITFSNGNYTFNRGQYYIANNVTIQNATVTVPSVTATNICAIYVGNNFSVTNSSVNWNNSLTDATIDAQKELGPRTFQVYFVGSGRPRTNDNRLTIAASNTSFHAFGKAMTVNVTDSDVWGGFKGYRFFATNSTLNYHRVRLQAPLMTYESPAVAARNQRMAGAVGLMTARLFPHPIVGQVADPFHLYPQQRNPFSAWSTEGMAEDEAEGGEAGEDYGGGSGY